jgi:glycosyltransferase involved in cell wall biosynthesis
MSALVSIILPTYNGEKYIRTSVESCLNQTYTNIELIIVNDCSKDNTLAIAEAYAKQDTRVKVINNPINKKLPLSLNEGFKHATGAYYTWTSDDNYYSPIAIETMVNSLEKTGKDLLYANYKIIDDEGKVTDEKWFGNINESFVKWLGCGACFLYKKEVHERNNGYDPSTFLIEDYDFFLRAFFHSTFEYLPQQDLYFYRHHGGSLTSSMSDAVFEMQKIFVEKKMPLLLPKLSKQDHVLLFRKYAVYNALYKNNADKSYYYLAQLQQLSTAQAFITVTYIAVKKAIYWFRIVPFLFFSFFKLLFTQKGGKK